MTFQGTAIPTGVVQSTYPNQMATALAGMLANSSDVNLVDSLGVADAAGVAAGRGVFGALNATPLRAGVNNLLVLGAAAALTAGTATAANFAGVALRTQAGFSATTQAPIWPYQAVAPVARPSRSGSRVWVETSSGDNIAVSDPVYVVVSNLVAGNARAIGSFTNAAITDGGNTDTVLLYGCSFKSAGAAVTQLVEFVNPAAAPTTTAELANLESRAPAAVVTASAEVAHARTITIQVKDANNQNIAARHILRVMVNAAAAYGAPAATASDTFGAPTAGAIQVTNTAKADYTVITDATGKYVFPLTHNDAGGNRWVTVEVGGRAYSSDAIAFDAV